MEQQKLPSLKVLAVDDNKVNLHILQVFLQKLSHQVVLAENGAEAVEKFITEKPDFVLMDIMMPVMNGFEATREIKALSQDRWVPVIFLSALNRDENLVEGLEAGGDDYLTKPINFVVLEAKLRSVHRTLGLQQNLIEALNRVQVISDGVMESILTVDDQSVVTSANGPTEQLFGWKPADLIGKSLDLLIPPQEQSEDFAKKYCTPGNGNLGAKDVEILAKRKDGNVFSAELSVSEVTLDGAKQYVKVIRDISERKASERKLKENAVLLQKYYDHTQAEQQLATKLVERQLHRVGLQDPRIKYWIKPAQNFSGDIVAAARGTSGKLYAMIADATGHGLGSAISVLPVLSLFYRMAASDTALDEMILEINQQLKESMPIGRFVAAVVVCLDEKHREGEIWVGGMPEVLMVDSWGRVSQRFPSTGLPLGIASSIDMDASPAAFTWDADSQLVMYSDGLIEAQGPSGDQFTLDGLIKSLAHTAPGTRFDAIRKALAEHTKDIPEADDTSILLVDCV